MDTGGTRAADGWLSVRLYATSGPRILPLTRAPSDFFSWKSAPSWSPCGRFGDIHSSSRRSAMVENMDREGIVLATLHASDASQEPERVGRLCQTCEKFDIFSFYRDPFGFRGYKYSTALTMAKRVGCCFCVFLVDCFEEKLRERNRPMTVQRWRDDYWIHLELRSRATRSDVTAGNSALMVSGMRAFLSDENNTLPRVHLTLRPPRPLVPLNFHVLADPNTPAAVSNDIVGRYPGEDAESDDYTEVITAWVRDCQDSHSRCKLSWSGSQLIDATASKLPTRCVEVTVRPDCFRLRETAGQRGSYIALSHR